MKIDLAQVAAINEIEDRNIRVFRAALLYVAEGIPVIPIPFGEKHINSKTLYTSKCSMRKDKIVEWFHPEKGIYKGYNIALGCGDYFGKGGVFAADVDTKYNEKYGEDVWGIEAWDRLQAENGSFDGPVQRTPNGGLHCVMQWQENLTPTQNRIAKGVDTRGGHPGKISSHIMAWPSEVDGKAYEWIEGGDVKKSPEWINDAMGVAWGKKQKQAGPGRGNEAMGEADVERQTTLEQVVNLLDALNPDDLDYAEWVKVGQAIHSQHSDVDGFMVWDEWSQKGTRYEPGECSTRWKGFKANGPVRMATLFWYVQEYGDASKITQEQGGDESFPTDCIDEYNRQYALVLTAENIRIARRETVKNSIQVRHKLYSLDAFKVFKMNDIIIGQDAKGNDKPIPKLGIWLGSPRRNSFDGMILDPSLPPVVDDEFGMKWLNRWAGFAVEAIPGDWSLLKKHILVYLCDGNKEYYEWLMDWMADMFQDPANPKGTAVILGGIEGAGKGTLANALAHIFGCHAAIISNAKHLNSQFNDMIMDSVFLFADEVVYAGNHEAANQLKAMVTEKTNTREQKFGSKEKVESFLHIMMSTNNDWKVAAGPESRRYFVLKVGEGIANDREYFGAIKHQLETGGYEAMLHELQHRDILSNLRYAPVTQELKIQRNLLQVQSLYDSLPAWLAYVLDVGSLGLRDVEADMQDEGDNWPKVVDKAALWDAYADWTRKYKSKVPIMASSVFFPKMQVLGFNEGPRKSVKGGRIRTINVPSWDDLAKSAETTYAIIVQGD